jgi:hypothetical protein
VTKGSETLGLHAPYLCDQSIVAVDEKVCFDGASEQVPRMRRCCCWLVPPAVPVIVPAREAGC